MQAMIAPVFESTQPTEASFKVAARMELKWPAIGIPQNFDVGGFFAEVSQESRNHT